MNINHVLEMLDSIEKNELQKDLIQVGESGTLHTKDRKTFADHYRRIIQIDQLEQRHIDRIEIVFARLKKGHFNEHQGF